MFSLVENIILSNLGFQDLFLCRKYDHEIEYGDPNSTCNIRVIGKGV